MKRATRISSLAIWCPTHSIAIDNEQVSTKRLQVDNFGGMF